MVQCDINIYDIDVASDYCEAYQNTYGESRVPNFLIQNFNLWTGAHIFMKGNLLVLRDSF